MMPIARGSDDSSFTTRRQAYVTHVLFCCWLVLALLPVEAVSDGDATGCCDCCCRGWLSVTGGAAAGLVLLLETDGADDTSGDFVVVSCCFFFLPVCAHVVDTHRGTMGVWQQ